MNSLFKERKTLYIMLSLVLVCVFTLTIAYSALSAVLTINGNARVSAADWDIYLNNPRVSNGSATINVPEIKTSSTLEFSTTLNMPGDFYEFVVDVVNGGDIDAMIENVVKTPDLTADQAKFLKYEVSYQNGEAITTKQTLAKDTTMPIKVRIEYRKDLNNTDLPTGQVVLDLALTLEYVQSNGTGSSVNNNGVYNPVSANGDVNEIGTIVTIGSEQFYTIGTEDNNVKLLAMYNLYVGNMYNNITNELTPFGDEATGMQDSRMLGFFDYENNVMHYGVVAMTRTSSCEYSGSLIEEYVNNYKGILETNYDVNIVDSRLISYNELVDSNTFDCQLYWKCSNKYPWISSTSYWSNYGCWGLVNGEYAGDWAVEHTMGVRPVIVISKDYFA